MTAEPAEPAEPADQDGVDRVRVCALSELEPGSAVTMAAIATGAPDAISVFRDGDLIAALDDTCSHARASLGEGFVEDGCVECPLHGALFRLSDGAALTLPAVRPVRTHRVAVEDGVIWLYPGAPSDTGTA